MFNTLLCEISCIIWDENAFNQHFNSFWNSLRNSFWNKKHNKMMFFIYARNGPMSFWHDFFHWKYYTRLFYIESLWWNFQTNRYGGSLLNFHLKMLVFRGWGPIPPALVVQMSHGSVWHLYPSLQHLGFASMLQRILDLSLTFSTAQITFPSGLENLSHFTHRI